MTTPLRNDRGLRKVHRGAAHFIGILAVASLLATPTGYTQQPPRRLRVFGFEPHPLTNPSGPVCQTPGGGLGTLPNAIINQRAFQQQGDGQSELTLAAFGNIVVAAFNDCTGFATPDLRNGAVGWAFSTDGAQTWTDLGSEGKLQKVM
jgi:hypothetical protein